MEGEGNDTPRALARGDVPQPGTDTLHGENGNDRFRTRDGEADTIDCGAGTDRAQLDLVDVTADDGGEPERVLRDRHAPAPSAR